MTEPEAPGIVPSMPLADAAILSSIGSAATILLGIVQSKVTAVILGPSGLGELAELRQVAATVLVPLGVFNGAPFVALIARAHGRGDRAGEQRAYDVLTTLAVVVGVVLSVGVVVVGARVMPTALLALGLAAVGTTAQVWRTLPSQALLAVHHVRTSTIITIVAAVVGAALVCGGTYAFGVVGQLAATAGAGLLVWPLGMVLARRAYPSLRMVPRPRIHGDVLRQAAAIGAASIFAGLAMQGALSVVRWTLDRAGGSEANGQFQAAWLVGTNYLVVVLLSLGNVVFPGYAAATRAEQLQARVEEAGKFVMRVAPPIVLLGIALRALAIRVFYTDRFDAAADVLGLMMAGDVAKAVSYVQGGPLLYRGHVGTFVATEAFGWGLQALIAVVLVPRLGLLGAGWAFVISYGAYAVLTAFVVERKCRISVNRGRTWASVAFALVAVGCVHLTKVHVGFQIALVVVALLLAHRAGLIRAAVHRLRRLLGAKSNAGRSST